MSTSDGYMLLFKKSSMYDSEWGNFSDTGLKISEDDNNDFPYDQPRQSHGKPTDLHDNPREVHSIPFQNEGFEPAKTRPIPSNFNIQRYKEHL